MRPVDVIPAVGIWLMFVALGLGSWPLGGVGLMLIVGWAILRDKRSSR